MKLMLVNDENDELIKTWPVGLRTNQDKHTYDLNRPLVAQVLIIEIKDEINKRLLHEEKVKL